MPKQLQYNQPKATKNKLTITDADASVGSLETHGIVRPTATAELGKETWHYAKKGVLTTQTIISDHTGQEIAVLRQPALRQKGTLVIGGTAYTFKPQGIHLKSQFVWQDQDKTTLITYKLGGVIKRKGTIDIADSVQAAPELQLLIPLGLFLGIQQDDDSAAAGA